jgi:hypothetical protein
MIQIAIVPPTEVELREKTLRPFVERMDSAAPGHWTWEYVRDEVEAENLHLWFAVEGKQILMLVGCAPFTAPGGRKYYDVLFAAGCRVRDVFHPMMDAFDELARESEAVTRIPHGRIGWKKLMEERGMKPVAYTYEAGH